MIRSLTRISRCLSAALIASSAGAIEPGQIDTFDDGFTNGWRIGPRASVSQQPTSEPDCGATGMGDRCLRVFSTGMGDQASRMAVFNSQQWAGNYLAAGVIGIRMRARNALFFDNLELRVRLERGVGGGSQNADFVLSRESVSLVPQADYVTATFLFDAERFTGDANELNVVLENVTKLWLFHNRSSTWVPPKAPRSLRVDNIEALVNEIFTSGFEAP